MEYDITPHARKDHKFSLEINLHLVGRGLYGQFEFEIEVHDNELDEDVYKYIQAYSVRLAQNKIDSIVTKLKDDETLMLGMDFGFVTERKVV